MPTSLVLTIIGDDQPGLVETLARTIGAHDGNWLESRMAHMAGKFAGIVRVAVPESDAGALQRSLTALGSKGLKVVVESSEEGAAESFTAASLDLVGADHPGIVHELSQVLNRRGINIEDLSTECTAAPMSGEPLFRASAQLRLPAGLSVTELKAELEEVAQSLMVDIRLVDPLDTTIPPRSHFSRRGS